MRLTKNEIKVIKETITEVFGTEAVVRLFGSRVDDAAKGGDIDLLVTLSSPTNQPVEMMIKAEAKIIYRLGNERKIDLLLDAPNLNQQQIHRIAREQGVLL